MEAPPQIALAITQEPSFISNKTFVEKIPRHYLEQLINSEGVLQSKWDLTNYSQKYASQNYINEREQLRSYLENWNKKSNGFLVKYNKAKHQWGRVFPAKSLGITSFAKKTRNTFIKNTYYDFDLKNCQPEILRCICQANNIPCDIVIKYCNERESIIANIIASSGGKCNRDMVKSLIIRLSFMGGFDGWITENDLDLFPEPVIVKQYRQEVNTIANLIKNANPDLFKTMSRLKKEKGEDNVMGSFLSTYLQEYELRLVENVMKYLCYETSICSTDKPNQFLATYEFDGLKLLKERIEEYGGIESILILLNNLNMKMGFNILWEIKPIEKFYDFVFIAPPALNPEDEKERIKDEKEFEKKAYKEKEQKQKLEERAVLVSKHKGLLASNDKEASEMIYKQIKANIKFSDKTFYYKYNYLWVSDEGMVRSLVSNYIRNSGIKRLNTFNNKIEDFVQHRKCGQNVLNDVLDLAVLDFDDDWVKNMYKSSLGKILFTNGYYDFQLTKFFAYADKVFDHSIIFTERVHYDWINDTDEEYIQSVKQRLFISPFGQDVADYYLLNIARGLAGDVMKRVLFGIGDSDSGKSILTNALHSVCGGYCGTFNANNLVVKKMTSGDDAQQYRWVMMLLSKRIIASSELKSDAEIDGTILKKISSGGLDKIVARTHNKTETEFHIQFLPIIFANDIDKIKPMDDAIVTRVRAITYNRKYVDNPTLGNPFELKKDENLKFEILTHQFQLAFMTLLMRAYGKFVINKRVEVEPEGIKKAIVNTFGVVEDIITKFQNDFEITNDPDDFIKSADIEEWIKQIKLGITMTKLGRDLNKYAELNKLENVMSKAKKIDKKTVQCWIGIKQY